MAVWKEKKEDPTESTNSIKSIIANIIIVVAISIGLHLLFRTSYDFSIHGEYSGPKFDLSISKGLLVSNYRLTDITGNYGLLSISDTLPSSQACISTADIVRIDGVVKYGGISSATKHNFSRSELDECVLRIVSYLDKKYIPMNENMKTYQ